MNHNTIYYLRQFWFSIFLLALISIGLLPIIFVLEGVDFGINVYVTMDLLFTVPFLAMAIYYFIQYRYSKKVELKYVQKVKLEKTYPGMRYCCGFVINMNIDDQMKKIETIAVYSGGFSLMQFQLDEYIGEVVTVGYDEKKDQAVIISE